MQGFTFQKGIFISALMSVFFMLNPLFANTIPSSSKHFLANTQAGCMGCHQNETMPLDSDENDEQIDKLLTIDPNDKL